MTGRMTAVAMGVMMTCVVALTLDHFWGWTGGTVRPPVSTPIRVADSVWTEVISAGHSIGPEKAEWVLVEFGDYECPACRAAVPIIEDFVERHGSSLRFVYRHWPLAYHPHAKPAALAAECAGAAGQFWSMHKTLYALQDSLSVLDFATMAARSGVSDTVAFRTCMEGGVMEQRVNRDAAMARVVGGRGTPTLLFNGKFIRWTMLDSISNAIRAGQPLESSY